MSKFIPFLVLITALTMTSYGASANTHTATDSLLDLKVTVEVEEEPFADEAYSVFTTDKCSAFAIQHNGPDETIIDPLLAPPKQQPKPAPRQGQKSGGAASDLLNDLTDIDNILTTIEKIGTRIWKLIEKNRPVVSVESKVANALPKNVDCWMDLENWQMPKSYKYNVKYTNLFGIDVVDYTFRIVYTYGATYEGRGKYLSNVSIHPAELNVAWGYTFNSNVEVQRLINLGTKEDPVAGMDMKLWWQISTPLKDSQSSESFFITGRGEVQRN